MNSCEIGLKHGNMVLILKHYITGYEWTVGKIGSILTASHATDFDRIHGKMRPAPPVKLGWYTISIEHPYAKGGYAFASLPQEHLAPHTCTDRCPVHKCRMATG